MPMVSVDGSPSTNPRAAVAILKADYRVSQPLERGLAEAELTLPQFNVLMELGATPGGTLPLYELNARLVATPPNTSWITTRMDKAGLVTKLRDTRDARVVILALTEAGWAALERALPLVVEPSGDCWLASTARTCGHWRHCSTGSPRAQNAERH